MITVEDLRVVYPNGYEALTRISLNVEPGEFVCVIGRSGAGKSTLLRCLNGLVEPTNGKVLIDEFDLATASEREKRRVRSQIGFVFQEYNLIERASVMTNVLVGRLARTGTLRSMLGLFSQEDRVLALNVLERVSLLHRAEQRADSLSGGEKQRVSLARALAQEPIVLLGDEPVASLDPELAWRAMDDIRRNAKDLHVPTVINTHDVELARSFGDRVIGIAEGNVVYDGRADGLTDQVLDSVYRFDKGTELSAPVEEPDGQPVAYPA